MGFVATFRFLQGRTSFKNRLIFDQVIPRILWLRFCNTA